MSWNDGNDQGTAWNDTGNDSTKGHENGFTSANVRNKVDGHEFTTGNNEFAAGNGEFIAGGYEFAPGDAVGASTTSLENALSPGRCRASIAVKKGERYRHLQYILAKYLLSHSKAECPKPRVFKGTCKICHEAKDCENKRHMDKNHIPDKTVDEALAMLKAASEDRDLDDFKEAFHILCKADPSMTYRMAEETFRKMNFNVYLIALANNQVIVFETALMREPSVNRVLLENARFVEAQNILQKSNEEGHKATDCTNPRAPRDPSTIQCRNCDQFGHVSRDCEQPKDWSRVTCTNCGEKGHTKVRCKQPPADENMAGDKYNATGDARFDNGPSGAEVVATDDWQTGSNDFNDNFAAPAAPVAAGVGDW
ncbi:putative zinc knuckle transcription factor [Phaeomoniella chlamydospora]|uniref:Putative zinc knuckle transcription factor n=1 Tax=Phaeomoniella chlamydospora TaxID=158046 RepID=A0A0G2EGL6_PHACM|nr:putative zinc knuckle transcription factor [Phaeomoniella chlamydospora]